MADHSYTYNGPTTGVTITQEDGTEMEVMLFDGGTARLPEDHPHVASLIAQKRLVPLPSPTTSKRSGKPAAADTSD